MKKYNNSSLSPLSSGLIFDMDGVLVDTGPFHKKSWGILAEENNIFTTDEFFEKYFGMINADILPKFFNRELSMPEIIKYSERKESLYRDLIKGHLLPMPGVCELISTAHKAQWKIGIGSSGPADNINLIIDEIEIKQYISGIVTGNDVEKGKPDPEVFLKAAEKIKVSPDRCIVIEDVPAGIKAAKNAGMKCIAVTTTHHRDKLFSADMILDSLEEISVKDIEEVMGSEI